MPEDVHEEKLSFLDFENKLLQTDGPMDKWTNGPTDGPNDGWRDFYRVISVIVVFFFVFDFFFQSARVTFCSLIQNYKTPLI